MSDARDDRSRDHTATFCVTGPEENGFWNDEECPSGTERLERTPQRSVVDAAVARWLAGIEGGSKPAR